MLTLQQLKDLDAVVTHGGFRAAARALDVSQAGLTKSIARLEAEYRVALLERQTSGVALTEDGKTFLRQARTVLADAQRAEQCLMSFRARQSPSVRLGVSIEPSLSFVPAVLSDFRKCMPEVAVHLNHGVMDELLDAIREGRVDAAVTRIPACFEEHDLQVEELYTTELAIVARQGHPMAATSSMRELEMCEWLVVGDPARDPYEDPSIIELFLARDMKPPRLAGVSESLFSVMSMLISTDCVSRLPRSILRHPLARGLLQEIPIKDLHNNGLIGLVCKRSHLPGRELQTLLAMLTSYARISRHASVPMPERLAA